MADEFTSSKSLVSCSRHSNGMCLKCSGSMLAPQMALSLPSVVRYSGVTCGSVPT